MSKTDRKIAAAARALALQALGERLRNARRRKGITQKDAAERLDVSTQTVRNWEVGRHEPSDQTIKHLASIYGVATEDITRTSTSTRSPSAERAPDEPGSEADPYGLETARREAQLSQREASRRSGISKASISRYERGTSEPPLEKLMLLAAIYGKPEEWFLQYREQRINQSPPVWINGLAVDEAVRAYAKAQPELSGDAVRRIAYFIACVHQQETSSETRSTLD